MEFYGTLGRGVLGIPRIIGIAREAYWNYEHILNLIPSLSRNDSVAKHTHVSRTSIHDRITHVEESA